MVVWLLRNKMLIPRFRPTITLPWLVFALAFGLSGCAREPDPPLRIALSSWPGYEYLYLAQEAGFMEKEGAHVRLVEFASLADSRSAFDRGMVDGMCCTPVEMLISMNNTDRNPHVVLLLDYSNGPDQIISRREIPTIADLRGRKVGAEVGTVNIYILMRALEKQGLALSDVIVRQFGVNMMEKALRSGEVDAVVTYPPTSTSLLRGEDHHVLFSSADIPMEVVDILCVDDSIVDSRRQDIVALIRAWGRSLQFAREKPEEALALMASRVDMSPEEFRESLQGLVVFGLQDQKELIQNPEHVETLLRKVAQTLHETNQIERLPIQHPIRPEPLTEALAQ